MRLCALWGMAGPLRGLKSKVPIYWRQQVPWKEPGLCSRGLEPDSNPNSTTFSLGDCRQVTSFSRASVSSQMEMGLIDLASLLLGIYQREIKTHVHTKTCI